MDKNFENILLRNLTHNGEFFGLTMPILESSFFSNIGNKKIFELIKDYYKNYSNKPSLTELITAVKNVPNAEIRKEIINSLQEISNIKENVNKDFLVDETVKWVKDSLYYEALELGSEGLMKKDDNMKLKAQQILDKRSKISINTDLGLDFDDLDTMIDYYSEKLIGIRTQHKELNKRLGPGFLSGTLSLIMAAAGIGKSLLMTDLISGLIKENKNILLVSMEMGDKEIMKRVHANAMDLPINSLIDLSKSESELKKIQKERSIISKEDIISAYKKLKTSGTCGKLFVKDYPAGSFTPLMLEQLVHSYKIEKGIEFDIIFADYMGIMKSDLISPSAGLYSYIKSLSEELRAVAKKLMLPIISASQLNRGAYSDVESADNSNISDSIGTAMTADWILFLLQDEELKEKKEMVCKCTKNRFNGRTDTWMMNVDYEHMRFMDMIIQGQEPNVDISDVSENETKLDDDFGIVTSEKQSKAESFADKELKDIRKEDQQKIQDFDSKHKDPFKNDEINEMLKNLGL